MIISHNLLIIKSNLYILLNSSETNAKYMHFSHNFPLLQKVFKWLYKYYFLVLNCKKIQRKISVFVKNFRLKICTICAKNTPLFEVKKGRKSAKFYTVFLVGNAFCDTI